MPKTNANTNNQNKKLTIGILPESMKDVLRFKNLIELETGSIISLGNAVYIASMIGSRIMAGERPDKAEIIDTANSLLATQKG